MHRLVICSRDLHWQWINWAPLYDTMEVSMLRLTWLTVAQHVFQPALTVDFAKNCLLRTGNKGYRGEQISRKIVSRELAPRSYRDFADNIALLGAKKWGPTCHRDISNSAIYATAIYRAYTVIANVTNEIWHDEFWSSMQAVPYWPFVWGIFCLLEVDSQHTLFNRRWIPSLRASNTQLCC